LRRHAGGSQSGVTRPASIPRSPSPPPPVNERPRMIHPRVRDDSKQRLFPHSARNHSPRRRRRRPCRLTVAGRARYILAVPLHFPFMRIPGSGRKLSVGRHSARTGWLFSIGD
jgi:hypothetical protein